MNTQDRALRNAILRNDFAAFIRKVFQTIGPGQKYLENWHIDALAWAFQCCLRGNCSNLMVAIAPRYLKSICFSVAGPAFILGHDPTARIICASYSIELAAKHSRDCRAVMDSEWYKEIFPKTRIADGKDTETMFETTLRGVRSAVSVGGTLTGLGGNWQIIDDPMKAGDATSQPLRERVNAWFDQTASTRMDDKRVGHRIVIQQRLHQNDLVGHIRDKRSGNWVELELPAIADREQRIAIGPNRFHERAIGDVLHPAREPLSKLLEMKAEMGSAAFSAQYQQVPMAADGNLIDPAWYRHYEMLQLPQHFEQVVQSWDSATKVNELSDYSVCITLGIVGKLIYILHVLRKRLAYPDLKRAVRAQADAFGATVVLIEDRSSGTQLIQELQQEGLYAVRAYAPEGDKSMRLNAQSATIENGFVLVPREAAWLADYLDEMAIFPNGRYDDQVDATSQALAWIKQNGNEPGIITWYRQQVEALNKPSKPVHNVKWRPPENATTSHLQTMKGRLVSRDDDGNFLLSEDEGCLPPGWNRVG